MRGRQVVFGALGLVLAGSARAQGRSASELQRDLDHLRVLGSVLYVAAHPDDENTRLIAALVGERGLDVTYLSLTRGGGGQNLLGPEQGELLSVIRTDELLAARAIDGASQRFTRAVDFGYSKSAEEALSTWGHDGVLEDVVRVVREVRPDVIITRFGPNDDSHGHHVASAILAAEAFEKAADPGFVTAGQAPWKARRLVRNESNWRMTAETDTSGWLSLDVGGYDVATGRSWGEVAADARTMHKSQGFGSAPSLGTQLEYVSAVAGDVPAPGRDLFEGLDLGWTRVPGGAAVDKALVRAAKRFDPRRPAASLDDMARVHALLQGLDDPWVDRRRADVEAWMLDAAGVVLTARSAEPVVRMGGTAAVTFTAIARADAPVAVRRAEVLPHHGVDGADLEPNVPWTAALELRMATLDSPDGQQRAHGMFLGPTRDIRGPAGGREGESQGRSFGRAGPERAVANWIPASEPGVPPEQARPAPSIPARFDLELAGRPIAVWTPIQQARTDRVRGEVLRDLELLPPITATFEQPARYVPAGEAAAIPVTLRAEAGPAIGTVRLVGPDGVPVEPASIDVDLTAEAPEKTVQFTVRGADAGAIPWRAEVTVGQETPSSWSRAAIAYPHIPERTVLRPAEVDLVSVAIDRGGVDRVALIEGSGDGVGRALSDLGYGVTTLDEGAVRSGALDAHRVLVLGIRAYNTHAWLRELKPRLDAWVAGGGTLIVQYVTSSSRDPAGPVGPVALTVGRGRVTDETAAMVPVDPAHPALTTPNALTDADFEGWVQERGLYFAQSWDPAWTPVLRVADPGEDPQEGSLLVARHGDGTVVYTGLAFFRQLPAGVPGAARLFANLLALGARPDE